MDTRQRHGANHFSDAHISPLFVPRSHHKPTGGRVSDPHHPACLRPVVADNHCLTGPGAQSIDDVWRGRITNVERLGDDLKLELTH